MRSSCTIVSCDVLACAGPASASSAATTSEKRYPRATRRGTLVTASSCSEPFVTLKTMKDADLALSQSRRPLVIGIGGGGDVVGALAIAETARLYHGATPVVGG